MPDDPNTPPNKGFAIVFLCRKLDLVPSTVNCCWLFVDTRVQAKGIMFSAFPAIIVLVASWGCQAHRVCNPGVSCSTAAAPVCEATPGPLLPKPNRVDENEQDAPAAQAPKPPKDDKQARPSRGPKGPKPTRLRGNKDFPILPAPKPGLNLPCLTDAYVMQDNRLYSVDLKTGRNTTISPAVGASVTYEINAVGFNPKDNYLYGTHAKRLIRIYADGSTEDVLKIPIRPNMGDFDDEGRYWCSNAGFGWTSVDLNPASKTYGKIENGTSTFPEDIESWTFATDWAYTPVSKGYLYGIGIKRKNRGGPPTLVRWSIKTKTWQKLFEANFLSKGQAFGAVFSTRDGIIYGLENLTGNIVRFNLFDPTETTEISGGPVSSSRPKRNDGTRCLLLRDT
ncbi:hypothetical protein HIM_07900 [Hirsutella minnesotensis 3608]|uniref:DUF6923 domain-containing protein n=1 Tax=Hirsutella minnesotensis 3608 TaxID=1043627 RepID=A0A0F7ZT92_9HYPO|nr:hypothetical protein HIM_07900 [Hirsutella minnesotensis 3608]